MIRALKRRGMPVAGADRMMLTEQIAVQDLMALADFLLLPEDDLALAVVLKSPLFGLDDDDLFALAHRAQGLAVGGASAKATDDARFAEAAETLTALARARRLPAAVRVLRRAARRDGAAHAQAMLTRLGPEAADAIDEFLDLALAYDREARALAAGLPRPAPRAATSRSSATWSRSRDEVRIMTVHGAKGLEAPIVFLPDTCMRAAAARRARLYPAAARGRAAGRGRPSHLAAGRPLEARRHRGLQGSG